LKVSTTVVISVALFIAAGLAAMMMLVIKVSNQSTQAVGDSYVLTTRFSNIGSLKLRAPVTLSGVRVGQVSGIEFDKQQHQAIVQMDIEESYNNLPRDTFVSIYTAGLLGEQYIALDPGGDDRTLKDGDEITHSQDAMILEELIKLWLASQKKDEQKTGSEDVPAAEEPAPPAGDIFKLNL
jgi:phospholipid/cholesterol/gamma-HCH transport system substrate-binding protein